MTDSSHSLVMYADSLARKNSEALSFIPRPRIEEYAVSGQLMVETENDEPCGFLIHGSGWPTMRVYQACIQYDARRREHGFALVRKLIAKALSSGCTSISLKCATDLESNSFWREAGFSCVGTVPGGKRRKRTLNVWHMQLVEVLL